MAKRNYKATEASNKHIREIAPIEFPGSKTFDVYEGFEADVEFYFEKYNQDVKDDVNDPNVDVVEYIAGRIDEKYPTENPSQFDSLIGEVRALLPKIDKDWYANMYNPKRVKEGKEQMKESEMSSSYVKQLKTDRRYYERTADGHWKSEVWQESKTQNRKQRIKEDSLDDPDIDLSQSFKGKDLEFLEGYQNEVLDLMREIISSELEEIGFKRVRFFSKDGYKLYSGGIFSKKVAEPGSNIYVTIEIGEFGKIEADGISYNAEDLANKLCKAIEDWAPLLPVKVDAVYKAGSSGIDSAQWKIRLYHEVPEDILGPGKSQDSKEDQVRDNLTESSSNEELNSDEKSIVEEIIQADFESGLTSNDRESVLDMFKEDDVLSDKAEAATEYYFELLEYGPAGILEVITDNWSDDYLAEYGEFDDEDCGDWETEKSIDINSTADWYKVSQIEGLMYMHKGMTAEEAKEVLGIDPSYVYVPSGNLEK